MSAERGPDRLSQISTVWEVLQQAHAGSDDEKSAARRLLLERYGGAVRRYLHKLLGDPEAAEDLTQDFAVALVRGDFRHADPKKGRFRQYVKSALIHQVSKHLRRRRPLALPPDSPEMAGLAARAEDDVDFDRSWRAELLARSWDALAAAHPGWHKVLKWRSDHPDDSSEAMAAALSERLGKPMTAEALRQALHRARAWFADCLLCAVAGSLEDPTVERIEEEVADLELLKYCKSAIERRKKGK